MRIAKLDSPHVVIARGFITIVKHPVAGVFGCLFLLRVLLGGSMNAVSVRELRRRWKPHKDRHNGCEPGQSTLIRFHRACSWVSRVETMAEEDDADLALVSLWIAFNSLYGQWDRERREPAPDRGCWRAFVDRILVLDTNKHTIGTLQEHKRLVMSLLEDDCLSTTYWRDPSKRRDGHARRMKSTAQSWYLAEQWTMVLDELLDRIYLMRCQLVHGAATYGGKLNRTSLRHCVCMLQHLMSTFLLVWIEFGADQNWGPMCYPPLTERVDARRGKLPR